MKKQTLLLTFLFLASLGQAQEVFTFANTTGRIVTNLDDKLPEKPSANMEDVLKKEIQLFTDFANKELSYPDLPKSDCIEGEVIVRVVFDGAFKSPSIVKSLNPILDKMVLDKITEYITNFDRVYPNSPRLVFKIPINFRLEG